MRHVVIVLVSVALGLVAGCSGESTKSSESTKGKSGESAKSKTGESAKSQCDKLFVHVAKLKGKKVDTSSKKSKQDRTAFQSFCVQKLNTKTRSCMLAAKSQEEGKGCLKFMDESVKSGEGFKRYAAKSKTTEARLFLRKIVSGARMYYLDPPSAGMTPTAPQFPGPSQAPTPPLGTCCKTGGKCQPSAALWTSPVWMTLKFSVDDPHYYSYSYIVNGDTFTARANGDLDCDGKYSTFEIIGKAGQAAGTLTRTDELE